MHKLRPKSIYGTKVVCSVIKINSGSSFKFQDQQTSASEEKYIYMFLYYICARGSPWSDDLDHFYNFVPSSKEGSVLNLALID